VPYFWVEKKQISKIAARRLRSIAVTTEGEVFEWGFVGSEGT
jgi:alpha-tubulin suppressor-like RCC1 family protein